MHPLLRDRECGDEGKKDPGGPFRVFHSFPVRLREERGGRLWRELTYELVSSAFQEAGQNRLLLC
jgi:hypothetical protein